MTASITSISEKPRVHLMEENDTLLLEGSVTLETIPELSQAIENYLTKKVYCIDWSKVEKVDSSALAMIFSWIRNGHQIKNLHLPENLQVLAKLYCLDKFCIT